MKMYPDSKLPLKPEGRLERFLLYMFERSGERGLVGSAALFFVILGIWALTQSWLFGVFAALSLINTYHGLEARAVSRMIRRASSLEHDHVA
jgi:hypothetical protein